MIDVVQTNVQRPGKEGDSASKKASQASRRRGAVDVSCVLIVTKKNSSQQANTGAKMEKETRKGQCRRVKHNKFCNTDINRTTCFGLLRGHHQVQQALWRHIYYM